MLRNFFLLLTLTLVSCDKNVTHHIDEEIIVLYHKTETVTSNLDIIFSELMEESRCLPNSECVWEGRALVKLTLNNKDEVILGLGNLINPSPQEPYKNSIEYNNYSIELISVDYGSEENFNIKKHYLITLKIKNAIRS